MLPSANSLAIFKRSGPDDKENDQNDGSRETTTAASPANTNIKRMKTFPSVRNQFVIHVYYRLNDNEIIQDIRDDYGDISEKITFEQDVHISLVYGHYAVQYHQIEPLMNQLSELIKSFEVFSLCLNHVKILPNSDQSRYFIAVCETKPNEEWKNNDDESPTKSLMNKLKPQNMNRILIKSIHNILKQYRSEILIVDNEKLDNFMFHTSIAWFLPENRSMAESICDQLNDHFFNDRVIFVKVNQINVKVGHISRIINLI